MSLYLDSSALLKHYLDEPDRERFEQLFASDAIHLTGRHTLVEVRRNLARVLGRAEAAAVRHAFLADVRSIFIVELDADVCDDAAELAERTGVRSLDALHLAAARRVATDVTLLTFDDRMARAARDLGMPVVGT